MRIFVKVKTHAKKEYVEKIDNDHFVVAVKELPAKGRANEAVVEALTGYFKIKKAEIDILSGFKGKEKIIKINTKIKKI